MTAVRNRTHQGHGQSTIVAGAQDSLFPLMLYFVNKQRCNSIVFIKKGQNHHTLPLKFSLKAVTHDQELPKSTSFPSKLTSFPFNEISTQNYYFNSSRKSCDLLFSVLWGITSTPQIKMVQQQAKYLKFKVYFQIHFFLNSFKFSKI